MKANGLPMDSVWNRRNVGRGP